jgi:NTP pyrophosphatase (non-canonical NTP hydrolase)
MDLRKAQKDVYQNKVNKGFNTTDLPKEFCYLYGEVTEAYEAYTKKKDDLSHELADIAIYLLGISEILGIDLEKAIEEKMIINANRVYKKENGIHIKVSE